MSEVCTVVAQRRRISSFWFIAVLAVVIPMGLYAQAPPAGGARGGRGGAPGGAPPAGGAPGQGRGGVGGGGGAAAAGAKGTSPVDLTGYWVSIVTEDYIERMFPDSPRSGTGQAGRGGGGAGGGRGGGAAQGAAAPADPCRVYAAGGSMRLPGRLNITWADDNTLKIDMDSGTQTRLFHFGAAQAPAGEKSLQGFSVASWDSAGGGGRGGGRGGPGGPGGGGGAPATRWASLTVVTTNMKSGYLLTSRSTYSDNATMTEYFNKSTDFGVDYLTVVATITDGGASHTTSSTFKKEPNGSKFSPSGCDIVK